MQIVESIAGSSSVKVLNKTDYMMYCSKANNPIHWQFYVVGKPFKRNKVERKVGEQCCKYSGKCKMQRCFVVVMGNMNLGFLPLPY